jgi:hypothetical protein
MPHRTMSKRRNAIPSPALLAKCKSPCANDVTARPLSRCDHTVSKELGHVLIERRATCLSARSDSRASTGNRRVMFNTSWYSMDWLKLSAVLGNQLYHGYTHRSVETLPGARHLGSWGDDPQVSAVNRHSIMTADGDQRRYSNRLGNTHAYTTSAIN